MKTSFQNKQIIFRWENTQNLFTIGFYNVWSENYPQSVFPVYAENACNKSQFLKQLQRENADFEIAILKIWNTGLFWNFRYRHNF